MSFRAVYCVLGMAVCFLGCQSADTGNNAAEMQVRQQNPDVTAGAARIPSTAFQTDDPVVKDLNELSLPSEPIAESDLPKVESVIKLALSRITGQLGYIHKTMERLDGNRLKTKQQALVTGLFYFEAWLHRQACVYQVSLPVMESSGNYAVVVFTSFPGQIPIEITFHAQGKETKEHGLSVYVADDSLDFASLSEGPLKLY
jgi:hypothetical protein